MTKETILQNQKIAVGGDSQTSMQSPHPNMLCNVFIFTVASQSEAMVENDSPLATILKGNLVNSGRMTYICISKSYHHWFK